MKAEILDLISQGEDRRKQAIGFLDAEKKARARAESDDSPKALEAWGLAKRMLDEANAERDSAFSRAIALSLKYYSVQIRGGTIQNGPFAGQQAKERISVLPDGIRYREVTAEDGTKHYLGFSPKVREGQIQAGGVWEDGLIMIREGLFSKVLKSGNPGVLASTLYHESIHQQRLTLTGWESLPQIEHEAYSDETYHVDAFELSKYDRGILRENVSYWNHRRLACKLLPCSYPFPTPEQEEGNRKGFEEQEGPLREIRDKQKSLSAKLEKESQDRENKENVRRDREAANQKYLEEQRQRVVEGVLRSQEEAARKRQAGSGWDAFFKAMEAFREMAKTLCGDPRAEGDFSFALEKANFYGKTYYDGIMSQLSQNNHNDPIERCVDDTLNHVFKSFSPTGSMTLGIEDFRAAARLFLPPQSGTSSNNTVDGEGSGNERQGPGYNPCIEPGNTCLKR
ncbi:MAG: hypothetical protein WC969_10535 [Elusimicrobiota bacterium]|jgi:hypothetical protein